MPELSRFYGIVIKMYFDDHDPSHFHAQYAEDEAVISMKCYPSLRVVFPLGLSARWLNGQHFIKTNCGRLGKGRRISTLRGRSPLSHKNTSPGSRSRAAERAQSPPNLVVVAVNFPTRLNMEAFSTAASCEVELVDYISGPRSILKQTCGGLRPVLSTETRNISSLTGL